MLKITTIAIASCNSICVTSVRKIQPKEEKKYLGDLTQKSGYLNYEYSNFMDRAMSRLNKYPKK